MSEIKKIKFDNGDEYEGEVKNGKPHGKGTMQYNNEFETLYEGEWVDGDRTKGTEIKGQGVYYQGEYLNDKPHGQGRIYENGTCWEGEYVEGIGPKYPTRVYTGESILPEDPSNYSAEENPRVTVWQDFFRKRKEYELEQGWTVEVLKTRLKDKFRNEIDKYEVFVMHPSLKMSDDDFVQAFEEFCEENNRKGHFEKSVHLTPQFVFEDGKSGFQIFADKEKKV
tara:strand:- start:967 stop:1638 length:672 start_codon:yes stop_codon:yes gene_type:complete